MRWDAKIPPVDYSIATIKIPEGKAVTEKAPDAWKKVQYVRHEGPLPACREKVFELLSEPGHLNYFHPFCNVNEIVTWNEHQHHDMIEYLNGLILYRNFSHWSPPVGFDLYIGKKDEEQSFVTWSLKEMDRSTSSLTITIYPHVLMGVNRLIAYPAHLFWVKPRLQAYLRSVHNGLSQYLSTGIATKKNYWGKHPWFSL